MFEGSIGDPVINSINITSSFNQATHISACSFADIEFAHWCSATSCLVEKEQAIVSEQDFVLDLPNRRGWSARRRRRSSASPWRSCPLPPGSQTWGQFKYDVQKRTTQKALVTCMWDNNRGEGGHQFAGRHMWAVSSPLLSMAETISPSKSRVSTATGSPLWE